MKEIKGTTCIRLLLTVTFAAAAFLLFPNRVDAASKIAINETNFPDAAFRTYVSDTFDTNNNDYLDSNELSNRIEVSYLNVSDLKGVEFFTSLEFLYCNCNQLTSLDISNNTELKVLECNDNQLTALDISKNTKLNRLNCNYNYLSALDISSNTALTELDCRYNQLSSLDVSKNTALLTLECSDNQLTSVDVSKNTVLYFFSCHDNQLSSVDLSKNINLRNLYLGNNQLSTLDISNNTLLEYFDCDGNELITIDLSKNTKLVGLWCDRNKLKTLDVSKNTKLKSLYCTDNRLTVLDVSKNTALETLDCRWNYLSSEPQVNSSTTLYYDYQYEKYLYARSQPEDFSGFVGYTATFTFDATGVDIKYQWQTYSAGSWVNSSLPGAKTNTLSVGVTNSRNGYKFRCIATDFWGDSIISDTATLHVSDTLSGNCGDDFEWSLTKAGVLTINCNGNMCDYSTSCTPWIYYADAIKSVVFKGNVTSIGKFSFYGCTNLKSITIPDSVTVICDYAFTGCQGLESITVPNTVTQIGAFAFSGCTNLTSVVLPNKLSTIERYTFYNCSSLSNISIPNSVTDIQYRVFNNCTSLTNIEIPNSVKNIGDDLFEGCISLKSVTLPDSITKIPSYMFSNCISLTNVTIPGSVTEIGYGAFSGCSNLTGIKIPKNVTTIRDGAFIGCEKITSIVIPVGVNKLEDYTFSGCKNLKSITIPKSVTEIGEDLLTSVTDDYGQFFGSCDSISDVYYGGTKEEWDKITITSYWGYVYDDKSASDIFKNVTIHYGVTPISITTQPKDYTGVVGSTAAFTVKATGTSLKYQWQAYTSGTWKNSSLTGAKTATLSVPVTDARDGYKFRCVVTDSSGQKVTSKAATLHVAAPVAITTQPKDYTGAVGSTATFTVKATGTGLKYQWQTYTSGKWKNSSLTGATTATLSVPVTDARDGYKFRCVVTDKYNQTATSNSAVLHVATPVAITTQPKDYTGVVGSTAEFKIKATGTGLKYQWQSYKNGKWVNSSLPGYNTATLSVGVTESRDGYKFRCVVTDKYNQTATSSSAVLHVATPAAITSQPKDFTGPVGSTAEFKVKATGTVLKYQWQTYSSGKWKNSSLNGATTATLSVPVTEARDGYKFRCVITDSLGNTVTSKSATLHVDNSLMNPTSSSGINNPSNLGLIDTDEEQVMPVQEEPEKVFVEPEDTIESVTADVKEAGEAIENEAETEAEEATEPVETHEVPDATEDNVIGLTGDADDLDDALTVVDKEADTVDTVSAS